MKYPNLFKPISIRSMTLKNRISLPPMYTKYANADGSVNSRVIKYFEERAKNGAGLLVVENTCVDWELGRAPGNPITIHQDRFCPGLNELVEAVHRWGAKIIPELHHAGRQQTSDNIDGRQPWGPSPVQSKIGGDMPKEMTEDDIYYAINQYVLAAKRAKLAGFDGVELHGAHGYLIASFISPLTNKRTDQWGGSLEKRCRFAMELVSRIRSAVGINFPILFRFSGEEWTPGSLTLDESRFYAKRLEEAGADALDVSGGYYESIVGSPMQGQAFDRMIYMGAAVKKEVSIPVFSCGGMGFYPELAEKLIADGVVDVLHFGRALLADPELPCKLETGRDDEIRHCIRCNECLGCLDKNIGIRCAINPALGFEYNETVKEAEDKKRVVVVGAGPCGMEYAITASKRGHKVTVIEKNSYIGGLAYVAGISEYKRPELWGLMHYYKAMSKKYGIEILLDTEANGQTIRAYKPDLVILATGSLPMPLNIPGAEFLKSAVDTLLNDASDIGKRAVIIGGSGVGIDLALFLKNKGIDVTVLEMVSEIAFELNAYLRMYLQQLVEEKGIKVLTGCRALFVHRDKIIASSEGKEIIIECDTAISAVGFLRNSDCLIIDGLKENGIEVKCLGPEAGAGHIMDATRQGYLHAMYD